MTPHQQLMFGIGAVMLLVLVLELVRRRKLREEYALFWLVACLALIGLAIWRDSLNVISRVLGTVLPMSALFGVGFFLIFLILLHFSTALSDLWHQNKQLAKEASLLEDAVRRLQQSAERAGPATGARSSAKASTGAIPGDPPAFGQLGQRRDVDFHVEMAGVAHDGTVFHPEEMLFPKD